MTKATTPPARWKLSLALYWRWLVGGPKLIRELASMAMVAQREREAAELSERDNRREVFKSWSLVCAAEDGTIIRVRPATFTLHVQGVVNQAVYDRLKVAWKESALLIRLPFPLTPDDSAYATVADWKVRDYEASSAT